MIDFFMARDEQDREDFLREATALVDRGEFVCPRFAEPIVVGFRREGAASFFFGPQCVLHFNSQGELRRAYWEDALYKSEGKRLVRLTRHRAAESVELLRHDLTSVESDVLLAAMHGELLAFQTALTQGKCRLAAHVGEANLIGRIQTWLANVRGEIRLAHVPRVG